MSEPKGDFKTKKDFTPEEWLEIYKKAMRLRIDKKLSPAKIGKIFNISTNTVAGWIYGHQTPLDIPRKDQDEVYRLSSRVWVLSASLTFIIVFVFIETSDRRTSNTSHLHPERWSREDPNISMSSSKMNAPRSSAKFGDLPQIPDSSRRKYASIYAGICQIVLWLFEILAVSSM